MKMNRIIAGLEAARKLFFSSLLLRRDSKVEHKVVVVGGAIMKIKKPSSRPVNLPSNRIVSCSLMYKLQLAETAVIVRNNPRMLMMVFISAAFCFCVLLSFFFLSLIHHFFLFSDIYDSLQFITIDTFMRYFSSFQSFHFIRFSYSSLHINLFYFLYFSIH